MELLLNKIQHDCFFIVGRADECQEFSCHRELLSAFSEVFQCMLNGDFKESQSSNPIELPDEDPETFLVFLNFLYFEKIDCSHLKLGISPTICQGLLKMADKYMIPELHKQVIEFIKQNFQKFKLLDVFEIAHTVDNAELIDLCEKVRYGEKYKSVLISYIFFRALSILTIFRCFGNFLP